MKIVLQLEEEDAEALRRVLNLSEEEMAIVTTFKRGQGLFYAGSNHVAIQFLASPEEKDIITTDRAELEEIKRRKQAAKNADIDEKLGLDGLDELEEENMDSDFLKLL